MPEPEKRAFHPSGSRLLVKVDGQHPFLHVKRMRESKQKTKLSKTPVNCHGNRKWIVATRISYERWEFRWFSKKCLFSSVSFLDVQPAHPVNTCGFSKLRTISGSTFNLDCKSVVASSTTSAYQSREIRRAPPP